MPHLTTIGQEIHQIRPFASRRQEACVALLRTASLLHHLFEQIATRHGITLQQYNVLRILRGAESALPVMRIAERLVEPTPGISRLIARLEQQGLIERQRGGSDARQVLISLTAHGHAVLADSETAMETIDESALATLSIEQCIALLGILDQARLGIRAARRAVSDRRRGRP